MTNENPKEFMSDVETQNYWRENYRDRPYYQQAFNEDSDLDYDRDFSKAYELGYQSRRELPENTQFEEVETDLEQKWENFKSESKLKWDYAKQAIKDAWDKL